MFSQVATDPLGGWASLILQGGAFALLTYIIVYMWPKESSNARDERIKREVVFTAALEDMSAKFDKLVTTMNNKFDARNDRVVVALEKQTETLRQTFHDGSADIKTAFTAICKSVSH